MALPSPFLPQGFGADGDDSSSAPIEPTAPTGATPLESAVIEPTLTITSTTRATGGGKVVTLRPTSGEFESRPPAHPAQGSSSPFENGNNGSTNRTGAQKKAPLVKSSTSVTPTSSTTPLPDPVALTPPPTLETPPPSASAEPHKAPEPLEAPVSDPVADLTEVKSEAVETVLEDRERFISSALPRYRALPDSPQVIFAIRNNGKMEELLGKLYDLLASSGKEVSGAILSIPGDQVKPFMAGFMGKYPNDELVTQVEGVMSQIKSFLPVHLDLLESAPKLGTPDILSDTDNLDATYGKGKWLNEIRQIEDILEKLCREREPKVINAVLSILWDRVSYTGGKEIEGMDQIGPKEVYLSYVLDTAYASLIETPENKDTIRSLIKEMKELGANYELIQKLLAYRNTGTTFLRDFNAKTEEAKRITMRIKQEGALLAILFLVSQESLEQAGKISNEIEVLRAKETELLGSLEKKNATLTSLREALSEGQEIRPDLREVAQANINAQTKEIEALRGVLRKIQAEVKNLEATITDLRALSKGVSEEPQITEDEQHTLALFSAKETETIS